MAAEVANAEGAGVEILATQVQTSQRAEEGTREEEANVELRVLRPTGTVMRSTQKVQESTKALNADLIRALASS